MMIKNYGFLQEKIEYEDGILNIAQPLNAIVGIEKREQ